MKSTSTILLSVARTCKKAARQCLKGLRRIPLLGSCFKRKKNASSVGREAIVCAEPRRSPVMITTIAWVHAETRYKNGYTDPVECEEEPKNESKKSKRIRRKKPVETTLSPVTPVALHGTSQNTAKKVLFADEKSDLNGKEKLCEVRAADVDGKPKVSVGQTTIKKARKENERHLDDVRCAKENPSERTKKSSRSEITADGGAREKERVDVSKESCCCDTGVQGSSPGIKRDDGEENATARRNVVESKSEPNGKENAHVAKEPAAIVTYASVTKIGRERKTAAEELIKRNDKSTAGNVTGEPTNKCVRRKLKLANNRGDSAGNLRVENVPSPVDSKTVKSVVHKNIAQTEPDARLDGKIRRIARKIIEKYERSHNLDDISFPLSRDENSCIRTRHQQFVTCATIESLDSSSNSRTETGKMFAELLTEKVLSVKAITQGIDAVLKDFSDHSTNRPHFFSYVAAIVAPLLVSKTASFEFYNLKYCCSSIRPSNSALFFVETLRAIVLLEDAENSTDFRGTLRTFSKWSSQSKHVPLDAFIHGTQINGFIKNDQVGVLLLAMAMFDLTRMVSGVDSFNDITHKWICRHIDSEITKKPCFVRTLTIATVIACTNRPRSDAKEDLIDRGRGQLLDRYVRQEFPSAETRSREIECVEGCAIISTALGEHENRGEMSCGAFIQLYRDGVIRKESVTAWKNKKKSSTRTAIANAVLRSFFAEIDSLKSIKTKA